jgi:hypothetical protein
VDPVNLRKVKLQESIRPDDAKIFDLRDYLFGYQGMSRFLFNRARDLDLAPTTSETIPSS